MSARRVNPQNQPAVTARAIRAQLLERGLTIEDFARQHAFSVGTVRAVVSGRRGKRGSGKSAAIRTALLRTISRE